MRVSMIVSLLAPALFPALALAQSPTPVTPVEHVVIIFQENQSFDHYFGTYPIAANPPGEPPFQAAPGTPSVNGLGGALLTKNPNLNAPFRIDRSEAKTLIGICDNNHDYTPEQAAYDSGLLDQFVQLLGPSGGGCRPDFVMGYVDGNTVTALWNYAQHFGLSDNHFGSTFGPSMPGAINLASGQTAGAIPPNVNSPGGSPWVANGTMIGNPPAAFDDCAEETGTAVQMTGKNIGDLLNAAGLTWGWFSDGFTPTERLRNGTAICGQVAESDTGPILVYDDPDPFDYYKSTSNPHHLPPSSADMIGRTDQANHQYEFDDFWTAAAANNMPAVSFLRGSEVTDGHPGYSDPLADQGYLVTVLNRLQRLPQWPSTVVFITWDDSDGWYDHQMPPIINHSQDPAHDALVGGTLVGRALRWAVSRIGAGMGHAFQCSLSRRSPSRISSCTAPTTRARSSGLSKTTGTWAASAMDRLTRWQGHSLVRSILSIRITSPCCWTPIRGSRQLDKSVNRAHRGTGSIAINLGGHPDGRDAGTGVCGSPRV